MKNTGYTSIDKGYEANASFMEKHPILPNLNIYDMVKLISTFHKNENAIDCLDLTMTFDEVLSNAKTMSKGFKELGIKKGDIISVAMPNFSQAVVAYLAANRIGAVVSFLNYQCSEEEIEYYLNTFESPLFIDYNKSREYNEKIKANSKVKNIITLNSKDLNKKIFNKTTDKLVGYDDFISYSDMKIISDYYKEYIKKYIGSKNDSLILFTSGSTGKPKSVVLSNKNIIASGIYMKNTGHVKYQKGRSCLVCVPFSYPYGFVTSQLMSLLSLRKAILAPNLSKNNISYYVSKNPNEIAGSPAVLNLMEKYIPDEQDLSSVDTFITGGDFLSSANYVKGKKFFHDHNAPDDFEIDNGSGAAETTASNTISVGSTVKPGTVGKVLVGTTAMVVDRDELEKNNVIKELKYGEEGALLIGGEHVFKGYYNNQELTDSTLIMYKGKKLYKTGNIGKIDKDGFFTMTGRSSRFYILSNLNKVYCEHVQNFITNIPGVLTCAVVPKPNDDTLYVGKACVVLKDGVEPSEEMKDYILSMCKKSIKSLLTNEDMQLKEFEIPAIVEFKDQLPLNESSQKVNYNLLQKEAEKEYEIEKANKVLKK